MWLYAIFEASIPSILMVNKVVYRTIVDKAFKVSKKFKTEYISE